jgi:hypothetical protein
MYALWHTRSRQREIESQEIQLNVAPGNDYTKEQEENLEKNGYMFVRKGGGMSDLFTAALYGLPAIDLSIGVACWAEQRSAKRRKSTRAKAVP